MHKCLYCGKPIKIRFRKTEKFCSNECCQKYHREKNQKSRKNKYCVVCGTELKGRQKQYCSSECRMKFVIQHQMEINKEQYKKPKAEVKVEPKKRGRPKKKITLEEINERARAENLTYGQYVAKYGL